MTKKINTYSILTLLVAVISLRLLPGGGTWYNQQLYPSIAKLLSIISSIVPFCISDFFYILGILGLLTYPVIGIRRYKQTWQQIGICELKMIAILYIWFNIGWGINYMAPDFYSRTNIKPAPYDTVLLKNFAKCYLKKLNETYCNPHQLDEKIVSKEIVRAYNQLGIQAGIHKPFNSHPQSKPMLLTPLYSKVGVLGSMGPFFGEFTLNKNLLPIEYADCWAHEYAHFLGIARENEATFYAYEACTASNNKQIRFSGYLSILPYVIRALYAEDENAGKIFVAQIRPEIKLLYEQRRTYWKNKYSHFLGDAQSFLLDHYLKSNQIKSGIHNYSEVLGLLISWENRHLLKYSKSHPPILHIQDYIHEPNKVHKL
ncbi:DUF3810 domain-containing protein [Segatella bryantii]|uniref:DUF3810 domain-containing protein n=1 Tax=Segatella bryantii TaxID=77095 RepID=UPI0008805BF2|nr:DUF3810 domain-containing protein [Segatella bryantii]SDL79422.1 Protein of unknown function [Segatella bryantii]